MTIRLPGCEQIEVSPTAIPSTAYYEIVETADEYLAVLPFSPEDADNGIQTRIIARAQSIDKCVSLAKAAVYVTLSPSQHTGYWLPVIRITGTPFEQASHQNGSNAYAVARSRAIDLAAKLGLRWMED